MSKRKPIQQQIRDTLNFGLRAGITVGVIAVMVYAGGRQLARKAKAAIGEPEPQVRPAKKARLVVVAEDGDQSRVWN